MALGNPAQEVTDMPVFIENEAAYEKAIAARIAANRVTGGRRRWIAKIGEEKAEFYRRAVYDNERKGGFWKAMSDALDEWGGLTDGQMAAIDKIVSSNAERREAWKQAHSNSKHIGSIGTRMQFSGTVTFMSQFENNYGITYIYGIEDANCNVIVAKLSRSLDIAKGQSVTGTAFVKAHNVRDGINQTIINRVKLS